jgi:hypothetical protein
MPKFVPEGDSLMPTFEDPIASVTACVTSMAKRHLLAALPPYLSVRMFELSFKNWSIR